MSHEIAMENVKIRMYICSETYITYVYRISHSYDCGTHMRFKITASMEKLHSIRETIQ